MTRRYCARRQRDFVWARLFANLGWKTCLILAVVSFLALHYLTSFGMAGTGGVGQFVSGAPTGVAPQDAAGALADYLAGQVVQQAISGAAFFAQFLVPGALLSGAVFAVYRQWQGQQMASSFDDDSEWTPAGLVLFGMGVFVLSCSGLYIALRDSFAGDILSGQTASAIASAATGTANTMPGPRPAVSRPGVRPQPVRVFRQQGALYLPSELLREFGQSPRLGALKGVQRRCVQDATEIRVVGAVLVPGAQWPNNLTFDPFHLPHQFPDHIRNLAMAGAVTAKWRAGDQVQVPSDWRTTVAYPAERPLAGMARGNADAIHQAIPTVGEPCPSGLLPRGAIRHVFDELIEISDRSPVGLLGTVPGAVRQTGGRQFFFGPRAADAATAYTRLRRDLRGLGSAHIITQRQTNERTLEERTWYGAGASAITIKIELEDDGWFVGFRGPNGVQHPIAF